MIESNMDNQIQKLYVEVSSRCNLRCKMCFRHSWVGERFGDLDPAAFARLMEDPVLRDTRTVCAGKKSNWLRTERC